MKLKEIKFYGWKKGDVNSVFILEDYSVLNVTDKDVLDVVVVDNVFKTAGMDMGDGLKNITKAFNNFDTEASKPYISSGNKIAEAAGAAVTGLTTLADKAKSFLMGTDITKKPAIETGNVTQKNQKIEFAPQMQWAALSAALTK